MDNSFRFFRNIDCKYFPCHQVKDDKGFNCLFCYCPLYMLEDKCGGNFQYTHGIKNCINCLIPHHPKGYDYINKKLKAYNRYRKKESK